MQILTLSNQFQKVKVSQSRIWNVVWLWLFIVDYTSAEISIIPTCRELFAPKHLRGRAVLTSVGVLFTFRQTKVVTFFHSPAWFWWAAQKLTSLIHTWGSRSSKFGWIGWRKSDGENSPANGRKFFSFRAFFNQPGTVKCFALMLLIGLDLWFGLGCGRPWEVPVSSKPYLSIFGFGKIQSADFGSQVLKCLVCSSCSYTHVLAP